MGKTTALRQELKKSFYPFIKSKGFVLDLHQAPLFITFRKITPDKVYVFDIQFDKYGKQRFALNFGSGAMQDMIFDEKPTGADLIYTYNTPELGRLLRKNKSSWFRQDCGFFKRIFLGKKEYAAADIVQELMVQFAALEDYWHSGKAGPYLRFTRRK